MSQHPAGADTSKAVLAIITILLAIFVTGLARASNHGQDEARARADALFEQRGDLAKAGQAAALYRQVLSADPLDEHAAVRLVRLLTWLGVQAQDTKEEIKLYREAAETAEQACRDHPQSAAAHYWLGVAYGLRASAEGVVCSVFLVGPIRDAMHKVIELSPGYEQGGAYRVLGRLETKLPAMLGGDKEEAERLLRKALGMGPRYWLNHLYLASLYNRTGRQQEALELVEQVAQAEARPGLEPETAFWRRKARTILEAYHRTGEFNEEEPETCPVTADALRR